jgi:protein SCO1
MTNPLISRFPKPILLAILAIVAASIGALLARTYVQSTTPLVLKTGTALEPPKAVQAFSLVDQDDAPFTADNLRGRWTLAFFGFTNCGDICPTTLTTLAVLVKDLGDLPQSERPQVIFVSVDAQRDTTSVIKAYVNGFNPDFVGVTGRQESLDSLTKQLGVPSAIRPLENGSYAVDHYAGILLFNPSGEMRALFSAPHTVAGLASDYRLLVEASR